MTLQPLLEPGWVNAILPELVLVSGGILLMLLEVFAPRMRGSFGPLAVLTLIAANFAEFMVIGGTYFGGTYELSAITRLFEAAIEGTAPAAH